MTELFKTDSYITIDSWINKFDNGYGFSILDIFGKLFPLNYSTDFMFKLCVKMFDCDYEKFLEELDNYKNSPIIEYINIKCKYCHNNKKTLIIWHKRIGKNFSKKGKGYYYTPYFYEGTSKKYTGYAAKKEWWKIKNIKEYIK